MDTVERRVGGSSEVQEREDPLEDDFSAVVVVDETHFGTVDLETRVIGGGGLVNSTGPCTERDGDATPGLCVDA